MWATPLNSRKVTSQQNQRKAVDDVIWTANTRLRSHPQLHGASARFARIFSPLLYLGKSCVSFLGAASGNISQTTISILI